ncbi:hypothetical protein PLICRDRAFT_678534 [Plicaturopsis crispa FD-325 SS-3]|nr:hypothetical protein PLICRDRAFT_678534 [Plicaturopsis crispa FD-325 SS-3]
MLRLTHRAARRKPLSLLPSSSRICRRHFVLAPLLDDLRTRGLVVDVTRSSIGAFLLLGVVGTDIFKRSDSLEAAISPGSRSLEEWRQQGVYLGFDPTARSLHVGHLLPLMCLLHFQLRGHRIYPLIGGATGLVGDPSGRTVERHLEEEKEVRSRTQTLENSIANFFHGALNYASARLPPSPQAIQDATVVNNHAWHKDMHLLEFLRTVGRNVRVNGMLSRDSARSRMETTQGLSFAEFTYQLLQAYDFYHLFRSEKCAIQIGGSDQWGNILAGLELINRMVNVPGEEQTEKGFGILTPLLTTSSGDKFGKSAGNAVWLDANLTSVFDFYQFFVKTTDADLEKYLKMFTLLSIGEISGIMHHHNEEGPHRQIANRRLADEVTLLVHGESGLKRARTITRVLFDTSITDINAGDVVDAMSGDPRFRRCADAELFETPLVRLCATFGLVPSISAARTLVEAKGLSLNGQKVVDAKYKLQASDLLDGQVAILRAGKDKHLVVALDKLA